MSLLLTGAGTNYTAVLLYPVDYDGPAYIARLPNAPSTEQQELIKSFILGVKVFNGLPMELGGIRNAFDYDYFFGINTQLNAKVNAISSSFPIVENGAPTWATTGYTGGAGKYLKNGFIDNVNAEAFKLADGFIYIHVNTEGSGPSGGFELEAGVWCDNASGINSFVAARYSGLAKGLLNISNASIAELFSSQGSAIGTTAIEVRGSTLRLWKNGVVVDDNVNPGVSLAIFEDYCLGIHYTVTDAVLRESTKEVYKWGKGASSHLDQADFNYRLGLLKSNTVWTPKPMKGNIFSDAFRRLSIGSDYINTSGVFSCNGSNFQVSNAAKGLFIAAIGLYNNFYAVYDISTGYIYFRNGATGTNLLSTSATSVIPSNGDNLRLDLQNHKNLYTLRVYNGGNLVHSHFYDFGITYPQTNIAPMAFTPAMGAISNDGLFTRMLQYSPSGYNSSFERFTISCEYEVNTGSATQTGSQFAYFSPEELTTDVAFVGDSNFFRFFADYKPNAIPERVGLGKYYNVYGGPGAKVEDVNGNEIASLNPAIVVINLGTNNKYLGDSNATVFAKLQTLYNTIHALIPSATIYVCCIPPLNASDNSGLKTLIQAGFTNTIDLYTPLLGTGFAINPTYSPDGIHINGLGQPLVAGIISTAIGF